MKNDLYDNGFGSISINRLKWFVGVIAVMALIVFIQLIRLQIFQSDRLRSIAEKQYFTEIPLEPRRGIIYDRSGRPLTDNLGDYVSLGIKPSRVTDPIRLTNDLAEILGRSPEYYQNRLMQNDQFVFLARKISPQKADQVKRSGWNLRFTRETRRVYLHGQRAAQLIGFVDVDNMGLGGIERKYNDFLRGRSGLRVVQLDVQGRRYLDESLPHIDPMNGGDIILTMEMELQAILEDELEPALSFYNAKGVSGLILDPRTGEILAMASVPSFDPNRYSEYPPERQRNIAVSDMYEPGSTFKIIGVALLLDRGIATLNTMVDTNPGYITIYGKKIHDAHNYGRLTLKEVLIYSSNVGMIKLTSQLRPEDMYGMVIDFGFGLQTSVELPSETPGIVKKPAEWSGLTKAMLSIGHGGVAVSMIQLAMAYAVVANGGYLLQPTLIRSVRHPSPDDPDDAGRVDHNEPMMLKRVISSQTASQLTECLIGVVERGTGTHARIQGMPIAGKTGTPQKVDFEQNRYYPDTYIASFIGYFPANDPRYLVLITVDEPNGPLNEHSGGKVAAPIFRRVAERIIDRKTELWSLVDNPTGRDVDDMVRVPDLRCSNLTEMRRILGRYGLRYKRSGSGGIVYDQVPSVGALVPRGAVVRVNFGPMSQRANGSEVVVPVLTGLSLRDAIRRATEAGLRIKVSGSGLIDRQDPPAGVKVPLGRILRLTGERS